ncbi:MAG: FG-GAP repeat domain-containing protein [Candidatus Rokuibacteriota bacterium]
MTRLLHRLCSLGVGLCMFLSASGHGGDALAQGLQDGGRGLTPPAPPTTPREPGPADQRIDVPPALQVVDPERDLHEIETISDALKRATMGGLCSALTAFDFEKIRGHFTPDARVQRIFPRVETRLIQGPDTTGSLVRSADPGRFGGVSDFLADLRELTVGWARVERCFFKPFRIFATQGEHRRASVELHFWLGGVERTGGRVSEKGDVVAEVAKDRPGSWRFTRLEFRERERFRAREPAFRDWTERARLPTDWPDVGYVSGDLNFGQILYGGIAVGDYDGDGWPDLYVSRTGPNLLLRNKGDGTFEDVTARAGVGDPGNSQAALFADFDNDGHLDLLVVNAWYSLIPGEHSKRGHTLYRNNGDGTFTRMPLELGPIGPASGASAADFDGDGLLDIYVTYYQDEELHPYHHYIEARDGFGNRLYRNLGQFRFEDVTERAGVGGNGWSYASAWADFDEDGKIDLYVANDFGDSYLFRNRGHGTFEEVAAKAGVANPANGMSADWGDYDNDGRLDLYVANMYSKTGNQFLAVDPRLTEEVRRKLLFSVQGNALYRNRGDGTFEETGRRLGANLAGWAWGSNFFDYDNDGWLDLHVANGFWAGELEGDA